MKGSLERVVCDVARPTLEGPNMVDDAPSRAEATRKPKGRKFYPMDADYNRGGTPDSGWRTPILSGGIYMTDDDRYYPELPERSRFLFDKKLGRPPRDIEGYVGHWLISDRVKRSRRRLIVTPLALFPVKCLRDGTPGPHCWLCNVVRVLDALDEQASELQTVEEMGQKSHRLTVPMRFDLP